MDEIKVSDLLICTDPEHKEVHIRDADEPYFGTTVKSAEELTKIIDVLSTALHKVFKSRK